MKLPKIGLYNDGVITYKWLFLWFDNSDHCVVLPLNDAAKNATMNNYKYVSRPFFRPNLKLELDDLIERYKATNSVLTFWE
jgi:hypothetical protein